MAVQVSPFLFIFSIVCNIYHLYSYHCPFFSLLTIKVKVSIISLITIIISTAIVIKIIIILIIIIIICFHLSYT